MKPHETATGFGSDQEKENPQGVIEAHTKVQQFIEAQINGVTFYDYGELGFDGFKSFCQMKKDIIFGTTPEKMAAAYPTLEEYGQRVTQWIMDKYRTPNDRYLSKAGELLLNFINQQLGITVPPKIKTRDELMIEKAMIEIHREIRQRVKPEELDSDKIMDEIRRTAPEDKKYEDELLTWYRKVKEMSEDKLKEFMKKNIPEEFQTDLDFLCKQNRSGHHYHYEDIEDMIPARRKQWRKEKIIREMSPAKKKPEMKQEIITNTPPEDSSEETSREVMNVLHQGNYPIVPLKLKPLDEFSLLERKIKTAYAKKEGVRETDVFVEDASTLGKLRTQARFSQNPSKTERPGRPIPLQNMLIDDEAHSLVRISIKGKETKWRTCEKKENGTWEMKPFPGKIFTEAETADLKLLEQNDQQTNELLKKWGIKDPDAFKKNLPRFVGMKNLHFADLGNGLVIRVTIQKKQATEYLWFDLMPMLAA